MPEVDRVVARGASRVKELTPMLIDRSFAEVFTSDAGARAHSTTAPTTDVRRRMLPETPAIEVTIACDDQLFTGVTFELTNTELFVVTARHLAAGARVALEIDLPEGEVLARGVVSSVEGGERGMSPGLRIRFESLAAEDQSALASFCSETSSARARSSDAPSKRSA